jgi:ferric-dicitrate binding protein FerR (iron transport regulator)
MRSHGRGIIPMGVVLLAWTSMLAAPAEAAIGRIRQVQGKVQRVDGRALSAGSPVRDGEIVVTGPRSSATVVLQDGVALKIGGSSQLRIGTDANGRVLDLARGSVLSAVKPRSGRSPGLRVRTRSATLGVRGTVFFVEESDSRKETYVCFCDGKIDLSLTGGAPGRQIVSRHHAQKAWIGVGEPEMTNDMHGHTDAEIRALLRLL